MGNTESYETLRPLAPVTGGFGLYPEMLAGAPTTLILDANMQWTKVGGERPRPENTEDKRVLTL